MIKLNIDVTKIPKEEIKTDPKWKGKFIGCILVDKPNERGDDGFISMDVTKEERAAGKKGTIIGNWKHIGAKPAGSGRPPAPPKRFESPNESDPDINF